MADTQDVGETTDQAVVRWAEEFEKLMDSARKEGVVANVTVYGFDLLDEVDSIDVRSSAPATVAIGMARQTQKMIESWAAEGHEEV